MNAASVEWVNRSGHGVPVAHHGHRLHPGQHLVGQVLAAHRVLAVPERHVRLDRPAHDFRGGQVSVLVRYESGRRALPCADGNALSRDDARRGEVAVGAWRGGRDRSNSSHLVAAKIAAPKHCFQHGGTGQTNIRGGSAGTGMRGRALRGNVGQSRRPQAARDHAAACGRRGCPTFTPAEGRRPAGPQSRASVCLC